MNLKPPAAEPPTEGNPSRGNLRPFRRSPIAVVTLAVVLGILTDRWLQVSVTGWAGATIAGLLLSVLLRRHSLLASTVALLVACLALGGLRHHLSWSSVAADDISRLAMPEARPVRVEGIVETPVAIVAAEDSVLTPVWRQVDRSTCHLRCEAIVSAAGRREVSGTVRLQVTGHVLHVGVGDRIEVAGKLYAPRGPTNPGGFDYRDYLRRQGVRAVIASNHPEAVQLQTPGVERPFARWRSRLRQECDDLFVQHLDRRTAPLAASLLLGERSQLPNSVREAFIESGTTHLLAISGLHVGILAGLILVICRLLNLPVLTTTLVLLAGIGLFLCVTNLRPPVVRASVLAVVAAAGWPMYRRVGTVNLIALCGLIVLLINPTDLFDTGTQLSFLAVLAIGQASGYISQQRHNIDEESLLARLFVRKPGVIPTLVRYLAEGYVITLVIWLFTLPLTTAVFHVAAPVGLLINVLLIPYVALVLSLGFLTIAAGLLLPWFALVPAWLFNASLHGLLGVVDTASAVDLGHMSLAGPSPGWLIVFYALLGVVLMLRQWRPVSRWGWSAVWGWVIVGLLSALLPVQRDELRCSVLDVGHGCCIVLQLPGDETVLYDAGMLAGEKRGLQVIQSALWDLGVRQIDGVVVSHADVDHFNAVAGLLQTMPVGSVLIGRTFLDFEQPAVKAVCEAAVGEGVPIELLQSGDRLGTAAPVAIRVVHPPGGWRSDRDNANSLVLQIEFAGRTILLTGDLEQEGLSRLMATTQSDADVLLAPHHGSRGANPRSFAEWARAEVVIVSGGRAGTADELQTVYGSADRVLSTHECGAISVEIDRSGALCVTPFVGQSPPAGSTPM